MTRAPWQDADIAFVKLRYEAGDDDAVIAAALGRTVGSVSNIRQAKGIVRPRGTLKRAQDWTAAELSVVTRMYAEGEPNEAIARTVGRSRIAIKRLVTDRGLTRDPTFTADPARFNADAETWRRVPDGLPYAVSSLGRVASLRPGRVGQIVARWADPNGYSHVQLQTGRRSRRHAVHRLVLRAFAGEPPTPTHQGAHNDGDPSNNSIANLRWATPAENQADRLLHGTAEREANGRFKGTADMVRKAEAAGVPVRKVDPSALPCHTGEVERG